MQLRMRIKKTQPHEEQPFPYSIHSAQQLAQLNLIQISNLDIHPEQPLLPLFSHIDPEVLLPIKQQQVKSVCLPKNKPELPQAIHLYRYMNRSAELKKGVADKMTKSFMAGRKSCNAELNTDQVCVIKRKKLPLTLRNFIVIADEKAEEIAQLRKLVEKSKPKPLINTRTYFRRKLNSKSFSNEPSKVKYEPKKMYPSEQRYWGILRGIN